MASHRELNSPACMLARLAYLLHLAGATGAVLVIVAALVRGDFDSWPLILIFSASSAGLRWILRRSGWHASCRDSFATLGLTGGGATAPGEDPRLDHLLERRSALEDLRGTAAFDPWELLALQHEIEEHLREHPEPRAGSGRTSGGAPHA